MSYQYEYLNPSCYEESEQYQTKEYEAEHQAIIQQFQYMNNTSIREEQREPLAPNSDTNMEVAEEHNVETESSKMRYHNADMLIQAKVKEIIVKKETAKTTLVILNEQKVNITQKIKHLQELRNKVVDENNFLTMNVEIEKGEFINLQKRVAFNEEIVEKLEQFLKTIKKNFYQLNVQNSQHMLNIKEQMKKICDLQDTHRKNMSQLNTDISGSRIFQKAPNPLKDENVILKAKIIETQTYLKGLQERCQEIDAKEKHIMQLIVEKDCLEKELKNSNCRLKELKDYGESIAHINSTKAEKGKRLDDVLKEKENIDSEIMRISNEKQHQRTILLQKEEYNSQLDEKINKLVELSECRKLFREEQTQEHKLAIASAEEKLRTANEEVTEINKENEELSYSLELIRQQYISKIEEKSEALLSKLQCEEQLHSEEVLSIKLLEEQMIIKKKGHEELLQKIEALSSDESIDELNKKKAYLISSTEYLTEKQENLMKEAEKIKALVKDINNNMNHCRQLNKESQEKLDRLQEELQEKIESRDAKEDNQPNVTPASILKSPLSHKKAPNSPKKVQFQGLSSFESSSNSEGATACDSQKSIVGKTFDDILEEIQAAFKRPVKAPKKRKLDIE